MQINYKTLPTSFEKNRDPKITNTRGEMLPLCSSHSSQTPRKLSFGHVNSLELTDELLCCKHGAYRGTPAMTPRVSIPWQTMCTVMVSTTLSSRSVCMCKAKHTDIIWCTHSRRSDQHESTLRIISCLPCRQFGTLVARSMSFRSFVNATLSTGFVNTASTPDARNATTSSAKAFPVTATIGILTPISLSLRVASIPLITGIMPVRHADTATGDQYNATDTMRACKRKSSSTHRPSTQHQRGRRTTKQPPTRVHQTHLFDLSLA